MRILIIAGLTLATAACSNPEDIAAQQRQQAMISAVRKGMNSFKGEVGGATSQFLSLALVGKSIVCGTVDGNDGAGSRRFSAVDGIVQIEQPGDAAGLRSIARTCSRGRSRAVVSRNAAFSDISVEDTPPYY